MAIADDFSVAANGDIRYTGTTATYTVLELHRFLQDLADNASVFNDDILDITDDTPSDRATDNIITLINGYNIDDTAAEKLYDGSITQTSGDTIYSGLRVLGAVNNTDTTLQIVQDSNLLTSFWGDQSTGGLNGDSANGILMRCLIKSRADGVDIDGKRIRVQARYWGDSYDFFNVTLGSGESVAAISTTPDAQNTTDQNTVSAYGHVTNTEGYQTIDLNNGAGPQPYYSKWTYGADTSGDGLKAVWEFTKDITETGSQKTIHGISGELFLGVTHSVPYDAEGGTGVVEDDELAWGTAIVYTGESGAGFQVGEAIHEDTATPAWKGRVLAVDDDGTTGTLIVEITTGTVTTAETFTGQTTSTQATVNGTPAVVTTSGRGLLLALDDQGSTGNVYLQLLAGSAPADNSILYQGGATATAANNVVCSAAATSKTIPKHFLGSYTGTLIGAYGVGVLDTDLTASDTIEDLLGATQIPPNNVTFTVTSLLSAEDRVLVGPATAGALNITQLALSAAPPTYADNDAVIQMSAAIPVDTPATGTIRVFDGSTYVRVEYTGYTDNVFTGCTGLSATTGGSAAFISYIDDLITADSSLSFTTIYDADRALFVRVRDGGVTPIKTFETPATLGSAGGSVAAIRTTDA